MLEIPGYSLEEKIFEGLESEVWRSIRQKDKKPFMLKCIRAKLPDARQLYRMRQEYEIYQTLGANPFMVNCEELIEVGQSLVLVLDDVQSVSLKDILDQRQLRLEEVIDISLKVIKSLDWVHNQGVLHKDISPSNILYHERTEEVRLIDFGISTQLPQESQQLSSVSSLEGTLHYVSPEQTGRVSHPIDYRSDYYSFGATLYHLITNQHPFKAQDDIELIHSHLAKEPVSVTTLRPLFPKQLGQVVGKLMAKSPESRYQSVYGLVQDLENCLLVHQGKLLPADFKLATKDVSRRFVIPKKLYGRDQEIKALQVDLDGLQSGGRSLCLVSGVSGVGKTALINWAMDEIFKKKGLFSAGKFDQLKGDSHFSALINALDRLILHFLSEPEEVQARWKGRILSLLGENAGLLTQVLQHLEKLIGVQPPVKEISGLEGQNRFRYTFMNMIRALCSPEEPLILFLDDLQWADQSSMSMLENIIQDAQIKGFFLIGAYRDNEVSPQHPLMHTLDKLIQEKVPVRQIQLGPLGEKEVSQLLAEAMFKQTEECSELARVLIHKTSGNPFFISTFLTTLFQEGMISFDSDLGAWTWNLENIQQHASSQNVLSLLLGNLDKLSKETQSVLAHAAVLGNSFDLGSLRIITKIELHPLMQLLLPAMQRGYIQARGTDYRYFLNPSTAELHRPFATFFRFQHDQVQRASFKLISQDKAKELSLQVGKLLNEYLTLKERDDRLFEIINFYNNGIEYISSLEEKDTLFQMNLKAAERSMKSNAYSYAISYSEYAFRCLDGRDIWAEDHAVAFRLVFAKFEALALSGQYDEMLEYLQSFQHQNLEPIEAAKVHFTIASTKGVTGDFQGATKSADLAFQALGVRIPQSTSTVAVLKELVKTLFLVGRRKADNFKDLVFTDSPERELFDYIMGNVSGSIYQYNINSWSIFTLIWIQTMLRHGVTRLGYQGFALYGLILFSLGKFQQCYEYGVLTSNLIDRAGGKSKDWALYFSGNFCLQWGQHIHKALPVIKEARSTCLSVGNIHSYNYASNSIPFTMMLAGFPLSSVIEEVKANREFLETIKYEEGLWVQTVFQQVALCLSGKTIGPGSLSDDDFDEKEYLDRLLVYKNPLPLQWYSICKTYVLVFYGLWDKAVEEGYRAASLVDVTPGHVYTTFTEIIHGFALVGAFDQMAPGDQKKAIKRLRKYLKLCTKRAEAAPMNFLWMQLFLEAGLLSVQGKVEQALTRYEEAAEQAEAQNYFNYAGLISEFLIQLHREKGHGTAAKLRLFHAFKLYKKWGAAGKVYHLKSASESWGSDAKLETHNPLAFSVTGTESSLGTVTMDLQSVVKLTNAITEEIEMDQLLKRVMQVLLENAGAQTGCVVLELDGSLQLMAGGGSHEAHDFPCPLQGSPWVCEKLIREVFVSGEPVVIFDAKADYSWQGNPYVQQGNIRSVLCQPLIKQGRVSGVVYLENNLLPGCFSKSQVELVNTISSQLAFSLENALLYKNLSDAANQLEEQNLLLEKRVEERTMELQKANDTKDQFFAIISHDLRGPVGSVAALFDGVIQPGVPIDEELLVTLRSSTNNTYNLLSNLLTWASSQKGDLQIHPENFQLGPVMAETLGLLKPAAEAKQIEIHQVVDGDPVVRSDVATTTTIYRNLVNNAIKFTPNGGVIEIEVQAPTPEMVKVIVADNGIGMAEEQVSGLFSIGKKVLSRQGTAGEKGTGLGLLLCKEFAELNQGEIGVESVPGQGSRFWFVLPRGRVQSIVEPSTENIEGLTKGLSILLVEDDLVQIKTSLNLLSSLGVETECAMDGTEALSCFWSNSFDVVLLDIDLPKINGVEVARLMRESEQKVPLLYALTSYSEEELTERSGASYFDGYLSKPLEQPALQALLRKHRDRLS